MNYFFAFLTGPSADIAGGHVLVIINSVHSCNNFAWELSWICLACSQYDAVSHWYSEGKAINTSLNLANDFFFFFFNFNQNDCHGFASEIETCKNALMRDVWDLNNARCECLVLANELPGPSHPQLLSSGQQSPQDEGKMSLCISEGHTYANQCLCPVHWCKSKEFLLSSLKIF